MECETVTGIAAQEEYEGLISVIPNFLTNTVKAGLRHGVMNRFCIKDI